MTKRPWEAYTPAWVPSSLVSYHIWTVPLVVSSSLPSGKLPPPMSGLNELSPGWRMSTLPATVPATMLTPILGGVMPMGAFWEGRWLAVGVGVVVTLLIVRTRLLALSAVQTTPLLVATPRGLASWAAVGAPPSPLKPGVPLPATVLIVPWVSISRTL